MDQRWSIRKPINLEVTLYYQGLQIIKSYTKDMSLEGMFVKSPIRFPASSMLKIEFMLDDSARCYQLPCMVVHNSHGGIGLMFSTFRQTAFRAVEKLLYTPQEIGMLPAERRLIPYN